MGSKSRLDRMCGEGAVGYCVVCLRRQSDSGFVFFGFSAEVAEAVFDGEVGGVDVHVKLHCFHFGCVELKEAQFGMDAVFGVHCNHVDIKVRHLYRVAICVSQYPCTEYNTVLVGEINLARTAVSLGLWLRFEVCEGVGTEVSFEGVVAVGCAFLSAACFLSFCHGCENFLVRDTIVKSRMQR